MRLTLLLALALVPLSAMSQVSPSAKGYIFRVKFTKGQTLGYTMTANPTGKAAAKMSILTSLSLFVNNVDKNGIASVKATQSAVMLNGKAYQPGTTSEGEVDRRMKPVGEGSGSPGPFTGMYPERAIKIGDSWSSPLQLASPGITGNMIITYRFAKVAKIDGFPVAVLNTSVTGSVAGKGQTLVRLSDGTPQRMTVNLGLTYSGGNTTKTQTIQLRFDLVRK